MTTRSWQYFRDQAARNSLEDILRASVEYLRLDTVGYMLSLFGEEEKEILRLCQKDAEHTRLLRNILATFRYLNQFEDACIVRNWFIGTHPSYGEQSPLDLFRDGQAEVVLSHLRAGGRLFESLSA